MEDQEEGKKSWHFLTIPRFIRKWYKIQPLLQRKMNGNSYAIYRIVPFPMTLR